MNIRPDLVSLAARYASGALALLATVLSSILSAFYASGIPSFPNAETPIFVACLVVALAALGSTFWRLRPTQRSLFALALIFGCFLVLPRHNCGPSEVAIEAC